MPLYVLAVILVAILTLSGAAVAFGIAYLWVLPALLAALIGSVLIKAMGHMASEGGWLSELVFYSVFYIPLAALNWLGSLLMIAWASEGPRMFSSPNSYLSPSMDAWLDKAFAAVVSPMAHLAYGVFGVNPAVHTPMAYVSMLDSGEVECVALVGVVFAIMIFPLGYAIKRAKRRKEVGDVATSGV